MLFSEFMETQVREDIVKAAADYADRVLKTVYSKYNAEYDRLVLDFEKNGHVDERSRELNELKKSWYRQMSPASESMCKDVTESEKAHYFDSSKAGGYGKGILSYSNSWRVYRETPDTRAKILVWAGKRADEKLAFLKARIFEKLSAAVPEASEKQLLAAEVSGIDPSFHGHESSDWEFSVRSEKWEAKVSTKIVYAGGYNIQCFHARFLVKAKPVPGTTR